LKKNYFRLRKWTGLDRLSELGLANCLPFVLCYHEVDQKQLKKQIEYLNQNIRAVHIGEILSAAKGTYAVTVDDCIHKDVTDSASVFIENQTSASYYLPYDYTDGKSTLWHIKLLQLCNHLTSMEVDSVIYVMQTKKQKRKAFDRLNQVFYNSGMQPQDLQKKIKNLAIEHNYTMDLITPDEMVISRDQIRTLSSNPLLNFESHTLSHPFLHRCTEQEIAQELDGSKTKIEALTQQSVRSLSYPYGSLDIIGNKAPQIATKFYSNAVTLVGGVITNRTMPFLIPRIAIYPKDDLNVFKSKIFHYQNLARANALFGR
jgi:hypothetical protein